MTHDLKSISRRGLLAAGTGAALATPFIGGRALAAPAPLTLLNVSYDPTRELYKQVNAAFIPYWKQKTGQDIAINQSHGGSGSQSRSVLDGLPADVVTLALGYDIDVLAQRGRLLPANWQSRLPNNSTPYTSTIVFVVKKGNPWKIRDWGDLVRPGIGVITPNPKTSGGARWNYLAAWAWAKRQPGGDDAKAQAFVTQLYKNVPILDTGARGATLNFVQRQFGDVLINWENEAHLVLQEFGADKFEIVTPRYSIFAEPPVAVIDRNADRKKTRAVAEEYLRFLYTPAAQEICAKNFYRPRDAGVAAKYAAQFPQIPMANINDFGGWGKAQATHFNDGGVFDKIYKPR